MSLTRSPGTLSREPAATPLRRRVARLPILLLLLPIWSNAQAEELRTPQFPLKTSRRIFTDTDLQVAKENINQYPIARSVADQEIARASEWLEWSDSELLDLIPTSAVPRAFNVGTDGCPKCGKAIYEKGGTYPWIIDIRNQFQVKCPVCEGVFPSNDFKAFYRSGLQDRSLLTGDMPDDGWGWVGPTGHRFWFVAYANHWNWYEKIIPGVRSLSRAYLLTGDKRFAHKAAVLLHRIAEVYPAMDHHSQSRYGQMQQALGARYEGKIVNLIWETNVLYMLAEAYDSVWETIDADAGLQSLLEKSSEAIRGHIEANLLEEGIESVFEGKISGNYGMHQKALVYAALARDGGPVQEWLDGVLHNIDTDSIRRLGLDYALYNLVYRDGFPYETAPGYNFSWVRNITEVAETLKKAGIDVYQNPRVKWLYDAVLDLVNIQKHTPSLGDSGSVYGGLVGQDAFTFQAAYRAYGDERYARFLHGFNRAGEKGFDEFETLVHPLVPDPGTGLTPQSSRLLDGYGMGILNNPKDTVSASIYYGYKGGHGHYDRLHFDIFANGLPMTPDLGYPDFMNAYVPGIYSWSKNTIAHNSVTVDRSRQLENVPGTVTLFAECPFARVIEVEAAGTYPQCSIYRRCLVMVDVDEDNSYFVDFFTVESASKETVHSVHSVHYSLHGPPGDFRMIGGEWTEPATGTLAGENVAVGEFYDAPELAAAGYTGSYAGYTGSGFQHLTNVQKLKAGHDWVAEWTHEKDPKAKLRIRTLSRRDAQIRIAEAQVSPVKHKQVLKFLLAEKEGRNLSSHFVSIIEPYSNEPLIRDVTLMFGFNYSHPDRWYPCLEVARVDGELDVIGLGPPVEKGHKPSVMVFTLGETSENTSASLSGADRQFLAGWGIDSPTVSEMEGFHGTKEWEGEVTGVDVSSNTIRVAVSEATPTVENRNAGALSHGIAHFENRGRRTAHPLSKASLEGNDLILTLGDDLRIGKAHLTTIESATLQTDALFEFAPVYMGAYLTDSGFSQFFRIREATAGTIYLDDPMPEDHPFKVEEDAWIVNVAPGDRMRIPMVVWRENP